QHAAVERDVERRIAVRQVGIGEGVRRQGCDRLKRGVIHLDGPGAEIRGVQESIAAGVLGDGKALVHGSVGRLAAPGVVYRDDGVSGNAVGAIKFASRIDARVPADDGPIFAVKKKNGWRGVRAVGDLESPSGEVDVEHGARRCSIRARWMERTGNTDDEWINA